MLLLDLAMRRTSIGRPRALANTMRWMAEREKVLLGADNVDKLDII